MRIVYWAELFRPAIGGVEVAAVPFLGALRERGHDVTVVACQGPDGLPPSIRVEGIPVRRFPFHDTLLSRDLRRVADVARDVETHLGNVSPDLVHVTTSQPSLFFLERSAGASRLPTVMTLCEPLPQGASLDDVSPLLSRVLRRVSWVAAVSDSVLEDLRAALPGLSRCSSTVPYGLPAPPVDPSAGPPAPELLVAAGRLVPEKGFDVLLLALGMLRRSRPGLRLELLGDGPERANLLAQAAALSLEDAVDFRGWVEPDEVPPALSRGTVVVVPSRWKEPFGLVALQAAQVGRPVVASRRGGLLEVVRDGETGLLVTPDDAGDLAAKLERLLADRELAGRMGEAATRRAGELSLERQVESYEALYARLAAALRPDGPGLGASGAAAARSAEPTPRAPGGAGGGAPPPNAAAHRRADAEEVPVS